MIDGYMIINKPFFHNEFGKNYNYQKKKNNSTLHQKLGGFIAHS